MRYRHYAVAPFCIFWYTGIDKIISVFRLEVIHMGTPRTNVNADDIIREYNSGKSVKALAEQFHVSRNVILQRLHAVGIKQRNRSESMFLRMSQTSEEERKRLAQAAHEAKRGYTNSAETRHKMALAKNKRIGAFEQEFIDMLVSSGVSVFPQEPFLAYNLDIGCGNIAVEIHTQIASPLSSRHIKKLMECVKSGKNMIYVWISPRSFSVSDACYKNVITIVQSVRMNPPSQCKYWVIRSTGEIYATGCFDGD